MDKRPLDILNDALDSNVLIRLKGQREFRGQLKGYDMHMNLVMDNAEEILDDNSTKKFGTIVVRGDNIIFISP